MKLGIRERWFGDVIGRSHEGLIGALAGDDRGKISWQVALLVEEFWAGGC